MAWNDGCAPREKLMELGAGALSDTELLAIFLRTGVAGTHVMQLAESLLVQFGSLYQLMMADKDTFCTARGVGCLNTHSCRRWRNWPDGCFLPTWRGKTPCSTRK
ncbi:hypothetical protein HAT91_00167 [Dickeya solani]|nr:hypothetical protein HAT91_00167 [Dickeya solani]